MKTIIAIKGHKTRYKEVIELLEMLGGKNEQGHCGHNPNVAYYISDDNIIRCDCVPNIYPNIYKCVDYTLEEFLEEFPYKVGDKVLYHDSKVYIKSMKWGTREIIYTVEWKKELWETTVFYLQPYKEETVEEETITIDDFKVNTKEWLIDKLHGMIISKAIKTIGDIHEELHKPQYPKTYEECCMVLQDACMTHKGGYKGGLIQTFQKLLVCRDAYWKIAGEQMKLGKPWEPNWLNTEQDKFVIYTHNNVICSNCFVLGHNVLAFPTAKVHDAFYENFKDLIEQCKELL